MANLITALHFFRTTVLFHILLKSYDKSIIFFSFNLFLYKVFLKFELAAFPILFHIFIPFLARGMQRDKGNAASFYFVQCVI
jgi:hypothetical protein